MSNNTRVDELAEVIIDEFENLGLGVKISPSEIQGIDQDIIVSLSGIFEDENDEKSKGLTIYSNGSDVEDIYYNDPDFSEKLIDTFQHLLNF